MSPLWQKTNFNHLFATCSKVQLSWSLFTSLVELRNGDTINLHKNGITYGVTDDFARRLGLNQRIVLFGCLLRDPDK